MVWLYISVILSVTIRRFPTLMSVGRNKLLACEKNVAAFSCCSKDTYVCMYICSEFVLTLLRLIILYLLFLIHISNIFGSVKILHPFTFLLFLCSLKLHQSH